LLLSSNIFPLFYYSEKYTARKPLSSLKKIDLSWFAEIGSNNVAFSYIVLYSTCLLRYVGLRSYATCWASMDTASVTFRSKFQRLSDFWLDPFLCVRSAFDGCYWDKVMAGLLTQLQWRSARSKAQRWLWFNISHPKPIEHTWMYPTKNHSTISRFQTKTMFIPKLFFLNPTNLSRNAEEIYKIYWNVVLFTGQFEF
jgi:hypothetical protein